MSTRKCLIEEHIKFDSRQVIKGILLRPTQKFWNFLSLSHVNAIILKDYKKSVRKLLEWRKRDHHSPFESLFHQCFGTQTWSYILARTKRRKVRDTACRLSQISWIFVGFFTLAWISMLHLQRSICFQNMTRWKANYDMLFFAFTRTKYYELYWVLIILIDMTLRERLLLIILLVFSIFI